VCGYRTRCATVSFFIPLSRFITEPISLVDPHLFSLVMPTRFTEVFS
jgi:hypothetical protein